MGNATLDGGSLAGATALTDGAAVFDIYFTLEPQQVSLDFTTSASDSLVNPNTLAVSGLLAVAVAQRRRLGRAARRLSE